MSRVVTVAAAAAAAVLGIAGCSSQTHGEKQGGAKDTASAAELARMYQEAVNAEQWQRICKMRTERRARPSRRSPRYARP
jgi:uncharacterized lipoprotein